MSSTQRRKGAKARKPWPDFGTKQTALEYELTSILIQNVGERGHNEGAVETLTRIIAERDGALLVLGLDRLDSLRTRVFAPLR